MRRGRLLAKALSVTIAALLLSIPSVSVATPDFVVSCSNVIPDFPKAFETSKAVFIGEVTKIDEPSDSSYGAPLRKQLHTITFKVEYSWKGAGFQEIGLSNLTVLSPPATSSSCFTAISFEVGQKYLVYAGETPDKDLIVYPRRIGQTFGKELLAPSGTRTMLLENAADDLKKLRRLGFLRDAQGFF
jgi:hypothetical protein